MTLSRLFVLKSADIIQAMKAFIDSNALEMARQGKPLAVQVSEYKSKRKQEQNAYYWLRLQEIAEQAWVGGRQYSREVWHEFYKDKYAPKEEAPNGKLVATSTTKMSVPEFAKYVEAIEAEAAMEYGVRFSEQEIRR